MANICYAPSGSCKTCTHFRFYPERVDYACYLGFDNQSLVAHAKAKQQTLRYEDLVEKTIVEIFTGLDDNKRETKFIHFYGFGYYSEPSSDNNQDHRFTEYTFFIAPLKDVLNIGLDEFESEFSDAVKQYTEDCTSEIMTKRYLHYNNGECPLPIQKESIELNTPDGFYILM